MFNVFLLFFAIINHAHGKTAQLRNPRLCDTWPQTCPWCESPWSGGLSEDGDAVSTRRCLVCPDTEPGPMPALPNPASLQGERCGSPRTGGAAKGPGGGVGAFAPQHTRLRSGCRVHRCPFCLDAGSAPATSCAPMSASRRHAPVWRLVGTQPAGRWL